MGNYCNGTLYCTGDKDKLTQLHTLLERLPELSQETGFSGDSEWMGHVLTKEVMPDGLFYEGGGWEGDTLQIYARASRSNGEDSVQGLADATNSTIKWVYVDDSDRREHTFIGAPKGDSRWVLRQITEESADDDDVYYGYAIISGDGDVLKTLNTLLYRSTQCAEAAGATGDNKYLLSNIFMGNVTTEHINNEGQALTFDKLTVYARAFGTDATTFFANMAEQLGVTITWRCTSRATGQTTEYTYNVGLVHNIGEWKLRDPNNPTRALGGTVYTGTVRVYSSVPDDLYKLSGLLMQLDRISTLTGYGKPRNWLPHIFTEKVTNSNIFHISHTLNDEFLEMKVRTEDTDGTVFFDNMANQMGWSIRWTRDKGDGETQFSPMYNGRRTTRIGQWQLRSLNNEMQKSSPAQATCQDIEVQLDIAATISTSPYAKRIQGEDKLDMVRANIVQHIYLASVMFRDAIMASYGYAGPPYPGWTAFAHHLDGFTAVLPTSADKVLAMTPALWDAGMKDIYVSGARNLYTCLRDLYVYEYPSRRPYIAMLNIDI